VPDLCLSDAYASPPANYAESTTGDYCDSVTKSLSRIERIAVKSREIDSIFNALWVQIQDQGKRVQSFELMVQALDCLSRPAVRYGRSGKRVFEANGHPIMSAIRCSNACPSPRPKNAEAHGDTCHDA
jgi:hypothetical protein